MAGVSMAGLSMAGLSMAGLSPTALQHISGHNDIVMSTE